MRTTVIVALATVALITPAPASAADCQAVTVVAPVEADAWIDANSTTANKGSDAVLSVDGTSRALVRFRMPAAVPEGCGVESARLRLFADSSTEGARVEAQPLASGWSEGAVSWETQPATTAGTATAWSRDGYVQWDVTSLVPALIAGPSHGFVLRDAAEATETPGGHSFYAREKGESPPELVIRFGPPQTGEPPPPAPPVPRTVACGQVVTESTLVTNDLTDCPADGLLIGAPRIVVDLDGHTIDGVGLGTGVRNEGYESVTVRDGTVQEFDRGVELLEETRSGVVQRLHLHHNEVAAIELFDAGGAVGGNTIAGNLVENNGGGLLLVSGTRGTLVRDNAFTLNSGAALLLRDSDLNRLEDNRVTGGGDLGVGLERSSDNTLLDTVVSDTSDGGIEVEAGSHRNRVEGSHVTQSGDTGILVAESDGNELTSNTTLGMSDSGITLNLANDGVVRGNQLSGNPGGLQMDGSSRNLVESNDASDGTGIGIELGGGSFGNLVVFNTANANAAQGIYVGDEVLLEPGNLIQRNTANSNGSDGITLAKGGHTVNANVALGNRGWGINAVGINFASANIADGNGQAGECLGIVCSPPDVTPPDTTIESAPGELVNATTAVFAFSADEDFASFECSLDGAAFSPCGSPRLYVGLADGEHELRIRATDVSGNVDPSPATHRWTIDTAAPETTIVTVSTEGRAATFTFSADEAAAFECALDDEGFEPCGSPAEHADLTDGDHTFRVRATDKAGNTDPTPVTHRWTVDPPSDTTAPETTIDTAVTEGGTAKFTFSADEPASFECALDNAAFEPCTSPAEYADLTDGDHEFRVRAIDTADNTDPTPATHHWTIDLAAPETAIDRVQTDGRTATFAFSADERSSFECALDDSAFEPCESPAGYADLADGDHEFRVRAIDAAGNADATPATHHWTIDLTAPQTTINTAPGALVNASTAVFTFSADEPSTFECALDDGSFTSCSSPRLYIALTEGEHEFRVHATDAAGNADATPASHRWTIDQTAPETTIDTTVMEGRTATFTFSADDTATFACALDDAAFEPCTSPQVYARLAEGDHEFRVRATDAAGNTDPTPASYHWTIDDTHPETEIDSVQTDGRTATFAFSADEPSTFECALDDAAYAPCESPAEYRDLAEGSHEFRVRATDAAGNTDTKPETHRWTIDVTAPETTVDTAVTEGAAARFTFSADEPSTFECALDDGAFEPCNSPAEYSRLADGDHTFQVRATDEAGNTDPTAATHRWSFDLTPPETAIDTTVTDGRTATFTFSADETSTFQCALDDASFEPCETPVEYRDLAERSHEFRVRATDTAGNADATPAAHRWTIDLTAPATAIDTAVTDGRTAAFTFSADEPSTFECALEDAAYEPCTSPAEYRDLAQGEHVFRVRATDAAGNDDATPARHGWTVGPPPDTTAPDTSIDSGPGVVTNSTSAAFTFASDDPAATFECSLDQAVFTACGPSQEYTGLAAGSHELRVRATDPAGNADPTPATRSWTIDRTPPETTIETGPGPITSSASATFTFATSEPGSTFECSLDGAAFTSCTAPQAYDGLSESEHQFRVRAIDPVGNTDVSPAARTWAIDRTPPETTIASGPPATTPSTTASFTFSATQAGSTFECSLDGAAFTACTSPREYANLAIGAHELRVRATDAADNADATPAAHRWTVVAAPACAAAAVTAGANADSWVLQTSPTSNYRSDSALKVDSKASATARVLVRFALPPIPSGCRVTSAALRLYAGSYKTDRTLTASRLASPWTEAGVTWANQPQATGPAAVTASGPGYREWQVTSQVLDMYLLGNHGLVIRDTAEGGTGVEQAFNSREKGSDNPPQLVIRFG